MVFPTYGVDLTTSSSMHATNMRRFSSPANRDRINRDLVRLPVCLGGMGLVSYEQCDPLAYQAGKDSSLSVLATFAHNNDLSRCPSQSDLYKEPFTSRRSELFKTLNQQELMRVMENCSPLARK
jgi:hypothetical protein